MDAVLCDELLQEIFRRLPPASSESVSLVSRRWRSLLFSSLSSLTLRLPPLSSGPPSTVASQFFVFLLSRFSALSSLSLLPDAATTASAAPLSPVHSDHVLLSLASPSAYVFPASGCRDGDRWRRRLHPLKQLRFLLGPVSTSSLVFLAGLSPFRWLTSLQLASLRPLSLRWLLYFPCLKELSLLDCYSHCYSPGRRRSQEITSWADEGADEEQISCKEQEEKLPLESLSLCGIPTGDHGFGWLWRRCAALRRLQLRGCEGTGDGQGEVGSPNASSPFARCLRGIRRLELRTCRAIADRVLRQASDNCTALDTLLLYDGGSRDALRSFLRRCPTLRAVDLRLPLDLDNAHLAAAASRPAGLASLRLQSCCLVTGDGIRSLGLAPALAASLEELALINCDVVEREPGLLSFLAQCLRGLRRLDLSHNEVLADRELGAMLVSCGGLVEIRLRGCGGITDVAAASVARCCAALEVADITGCCGITAVGVETLVVGGSRHLRRVVVEERKVSLSAGAWAARKAIQVS